MAQRGRKHGRPSFVSEQRLPRSGFGGGRSQRGGGCQGVVSTERSPLRPRPVERLSQSGACSLEALDVARGELYAIEGIDGLTEPLAPGLCGAEEAGCQFELPSVTREGSKAQHVLDNPDSRSRLLWMRRAPASIAAAFSH